MFGPNSLSRSLAASSIFLLGLAVGLAQASEPTKESRSSKHYPSASHHANALSHHSVSHYSVSRHAASHHAVSHHFVSHHFDHSSGVEQAAAKKKIGHKKHRHTANWRRQGQQNIDSQRVHDIQEALIREHYLTGNSSGSWDSSTQAAMKRFQADNGWQSTSIPDSRALIKLGLGPDHTHLLNPETAMTSESKLPNSSSAAAISLAVPKSESVSTTPAPTQDPKPIENQHAK